MHHSPTRAAHTPTMVDPRFEDVLPLSAVPHARSSRKRPLIDRLLSTLSTIEVPLRHGADEVGGDVEVVGGRVALADQELVELRALTVSLSSDASSKGRRH